MAVIPLTMAAAAFLFAAPPAAHAADPDLPTYAITRVVTIQPIVVCSTDGASCADSSNLAAYAAAANTILNQAGIGVALAPVVTYNNSDYLVPQVNNGTAGVFDTAHDLIRLPGHGQSTSETTLNVWFVNNIQNVTNPSATTYAYGYGLIGGNGMIVATSPDPNGRVAALDTLAHEIGHNLGLPHADTLSYASPYNTMETNGRIVPTDLCQVQLYTCGDGGIARDQYVAAQLNSLSNPLIFTTLPNLQTTITAPPEGPDHLSAEGPWTSVTTTFAAPSTSDLLAIHYRFLDPATTVYGVEAQPLPAASNSPPPGISPTLTSTLIAGHISWDARFSSGIDSQYQINTSYYNASDNYSFDSQPWPYSTQYDFSNGVVSRAGFDLQGNQLVASSQFAALFGFDPSAPGVVNGPSFLPQELGAISPLTGLAIEPETDTSFTTPDVLARVRLPFAGFEAYTVAAVPEPSSLALLATGATLVLFMAWTRRRGGRQACPSWQPMWAMSGRRWLRRTGRSSCPLIPLEPWRAR